VTSRIAVVVKVVGRVSVEVATLSRVVVRVSVTVAVIVCVTGIAEVTVLAGATVKPAMVPMNKPTNRSRGARKLALIVEAIFMSGFKR